MPVAVHEKSKEFHLYNDRISYVIRILENGQPGQVYFGKRLQDREDFGHLIEYASRDMAACPFEGRSDFSLEHLRQEYPAAGAGDPRTAAFEIEREKGSRTVGFRYTGYAVREGKRRLEGLPAVYTEEDREATTLELCLEDEVTEMTMILTYVIFEDYPAVARHTLFRNGQKEVVTIQNAMSGCLDLPDREYEMTILAGTWSRERHVHTRELGYGVNSVYSLRGCSSHQFNPFLMLKRKNAEEDSGEVLGFSLIYSGDFLAQAEVDNFDVTRVVMGIHPAEFSWKMEKGESFQTPEMVIVYSDRGMNGMSQTFHRLYRTRLARGKWRDRERPILINNWEATYFRFDEEKILSIAEHAKEAGIELLVLDDGWFGKRDQDNCSLGDWYPDLKKLPEGIAGLAGKIRDMGMKFGLWFEPEMVNKDSDLYREHPDWVMADPEREYSHGRNQYILDFSRKEVVDCIYGQMREILANAPVTYVKWDMNRSFSEVFSNGRSASEQGKVRHQYILGVYSLYERLIREFPDILFESCASGGARFDPGMLYYAPQAWTSDDTDAVERIRIQYGTSMVYPLSSMGSHVSASPNHQVFRSTSLETRANVAYFGTFGYELDITKMSDEEREEIRRQVAFMKRYRSVIQKGTFYRLKSPFRYNSSAWMVVSEDGKVALAAYYRVLQPPQAGFERIFLRGLESGASYRVEEPFDKCREIGRFYGDELMQAGLSVSDFSSGLRGVAFEKQGDYFSRLFLIKREE